MTITTYYLQMLDPGQLRPRVWTSLGWQAHRAPRDFKINRDFYREVGRDWHWNDRLRWSDAQWRAYVDPPNRETWIGQLDNERIGYFELDTGPSDDVEIAYFGVLPRFVGRGLGGVLLSEAVSRGWQLEPKRVWMHTCTLDHPHALANYLARGFEIYKVETQWQEMLHTRTTELRLQ